MANSTEPSSHVSGQANKPISKPAYALPYATVIAELKSNSEGLSDDEVQVRLNEYGRNELDGGWGVQPLKILLRQIANAMSLVCRQHWNMNKVYAHLP
jgi:Na+-exporting ATPase